MFVMRSMGYWVLSEMLKWVSSAADNQALLVRPPGFCYNAAMYSGMSGIFSIGLIQTLCKITTAVAAEIVAGYDAALTLLYYKCSFELFSRGGEGEGRALGIKLTSLLAFVIPCISCIRRVIFVDCRKAVTRQGNGA